MNVKTKWLSFVLIVVSALILIYGFIDKSGYEDGYSAGYTQVSRLVDNACVRGEVQSDELCDEAAVAVAIAASEIAPGDLYIAQTAAALKPKLKVIKQTLKRPPIFTPSASTKAEPSVASQSSVAPTIPDGFSPFMWIAEAGDVPQQSSLVLSATQELQEAAIDRQKAIVAQCPAAKILWYEGGLPETTEKNGLASCLPAGITEIGLTEGASVKDSAGATYAIKKTGTFYMDGSLGLVLIAPPPPPPPPTSEELAKTKALGIKCEQTPALNRDQCDALDPHCIWSMNKRDGSGAYVKADYTFGCTYSEVYYRRVNFNPADPCTNGDIQARLPNARLVKGANGSNICAGGGRFVYMDKNDNIIGESASYSELLRNPDPTLKDFAAKSGATAAPIVTTPSVPSMPGMPSGMPYMPPGGYMPGGCMPSNMMNGVCVGAAPRQSFFANLVQTITDLFRRSQ